jgi:2-C-methyl-D-erythritol 4-phosphate cytidylyltransferase
VTDDAGIMQQAGFAVEVVDSGEFNLKLTTANDFILIRKFYSAGE